MNKSRYLSFEELPIMLMVPDIANVLGIGMTKAYEVARRKDFPSFNIGTRIIVPRQEFIDWLGEQVSRKSEII